MIDKYVEYLRILGYHYLINNGACYYMSNYNKIVILKYTDSELFFYFYYDVNTNYKMNIEEFNNKYLSIIRDYKLSCL